MADLASRRPQGTPDGTPVAAPAAVRCTAAGSSAFSMRSSVDNPLWDDSLHEQQHSGRVPLSPLETALQALALNAPRSHHDGSGGRAPSTERGAPSDGACSSSLPHTMPATFEDWRPRSSEYRRAMASSQPPARGGGSTEAVGGSSGIGGGRSVSLSPVCWSLDGSTAANDVGNKQSMPLHQQQQHLASKSPLLLWPISIDRHQPDGHGSERQHAPESPSLGPTSPQPMESPLKRLRLSTSPSDWSLAAEATGDMSDVSDISQQVSDP